MDAEQRAKQAEQDAQAASGQVSNLQSEIERLKAANEDYKAREGPAQAGTPDPSLGWQLTQVQ